MAIEFDMKPPTTEQVQELVDAHKKAKAASRARRMPAVHVEPGDIRDEPITGRCRCCNRPFSSCQTLHPPTPEEQAIKDSCIRELEKAAKADKPQANPDPVNSPAHYTSRGIECIEVVKKFGFTLGNAIKYIWRADLKKDAVEDLKKSRWYVEFELYERLDDVAKEADIKDKLRQMFKVIDKLDLPVAPIELLKELRKMVDDEVTAHKCVLAEANSKPDMRRSWNKDGV